MGAYYTPPHPPRRAWRKLWLLLHLSREHRWAAAGLALALAMAVLLYLVMADNMVQIDDKRLAAQAQSQQRHACALLPRWSDRDQCLAMMLPAKEAGAPALMPK